MTPAAVECRREGCGWTGDISGLEVRGPRPHTRRREVICPRCYDSVGLRYTVKPATPARQDRR